MTATCGQGHVSAATDYCDTCGSPITAGPSASATKPTQGSPAAPAGAATAQRCGHCQADNPTEALFCEVCGYDFTTGALPAAPAAAPAGQGNGKTLWVAEVWIDPSWYADQESDQPCPSPGLPTVHQLGGGALIGRMSATRNIHPEIDCSADVGVSRRQAQLTTDGTRWWIEDLGSANGTYVAGASEPLPTEPLTPGQRRELADDDRIYVGAWTRLVVRPATEDER